MHDASYSGTDRSESQSPNYSTLTEDRQTNENNSGTNILNYSKFWSGMTFIFKTHLYFAIGNVRRNYNEL